MPELPEVETVVRGLRGPLVGRRIVGVRFGKTDFIDDPIALGERLPGSRITSVERHGKFISLALEPLDSDALHFHWFIHLGMTGQLMSRKPYEPVAAHTHALVELDDGLELRYTDIRRFGRMLLVSESGKAKFREALGQDPLEISEKEFVEQFSGRKARIKALLLDQSVLRGMGNIYTDESLWRARIHPARVAARLDRQQLKTLYRAMQHVLSAAIKLRGSSISDYLDAGGRKGEYQARHRAYGREGKPCSRCKTPIRRIIVAGRGSYFCPKCQAPPQKKTRKRKALKRGPHANPR
jgi:formamidopyrimidine-DNA glycosylase